MLVNSIIAYFDVFKGKCETLVNQRHTKVLPESDLINANNQLLSDLINMYAKCGVVSQYVSLNSDLFDKNIAYLFGEKELIKEVIRIGSNLSDYFGYCGFTTDSINVADGFSLVIDRNALAFSPNDVCSFSALISRNIRFSKAVNTASKFDPAYQLPTYSIDGVNFNIVPVQQIKYPYAEI